MCMLPETEAPKAPTPDVLERNLRVLEQQRDELLAAINEVLDFGHPLPTVARAILKGARDHVLGD